jgi:putative transposase
MRPLLGFGSRYVWLWVAIEPKHKQILQVDMSFERTMLVAERFIASLLNEFGKHPVSTDGGTWCPQACRFLKLKHPIHSPFEISILERTMQRIKDRTGCFGDYFPCRKKKNCKLRHVRKWLNLFAYYHNRRISA